MELMPARPPDACTSLLRGEYFTVFLSGVVARRAAILQAGLFDERFVHGEDFDLWIRMVKHGARDGVSASRIVESAGACREPVSLTR